MCEALCDPTKGSVTPREKRVAVFRVGSLNVGIDIERTQEINGSLSITPTPIAADHVRGVANLRGEVVTIFDLRRILGLESAEITPDSANIVVRAEEESIGLLVDCVQDVLTLNEADAQPPTSNVDSSIANMFESVFQLPSGLLVILNVDEVVARV